MVIIAYEIGLGYAVFTTPFSSCATAKVIRLLGAQPVFVDIDAHSFNIDPVLLESKVRDMMSDDRTHPMYRSVAADEILAPKAVIAVDLLSL